MAAAERIGFPVFVKASHGGGGRGMRLVTDPARLARAVEEARSEAAAAFGDGTVYLEQALVRPRHIEVQLLADASGDVVHLYERDCSLQRRHQKVIEITPAPNLAAELRDRICADAVKFARHVGYVNAGTVEFLLDPATGRYAFIEMNPRIQVEHTVTEETTDIDLVRAQLQIAGGATLASLGVRQAEIRQRGFALQCRVTTEDPANGFRPDAGRITAYRSPGGAGVRLDEGSAFVGAEVSPFFDPLLVKISARGLDLQSAVVSRAAGRRGAARARRQDQPGLPAGAAQRPRRARRPHAHDVRRRAARPLGRGPGRRPRQPAAQAPRRGHRQPRAGELRAARRPAREAARRAQGRAARRLAPAAARARTGRVRRGAARAAGDRADRHLAARRAPVAVRDAHAHARHARRSRRTSRTGCRNCCRSRSGVARPSTSRCASCTRIRGSGSCSCANWSPTSACRCCCAGQNLLAYSRFPTAVVRAFVAEAVEAGIDVFRIFDALNNVEGMRAAIEATLETSAIAEGTLCYTGDLSDPRERLYTLDYYLRLAEQLVETGVHVLAIKDMAGLLRAPAARTLVTALRREFELPVHLHTHDTAGGQLATYLAAIEAGVDAVDGAAAPSPG